MSSLVIPSLGATLGAVYLGATVAAIIFGITNLQTVIYYKKYPDDWWVYRYSVTSLWILDALHVVLSTHALYYYLINHFGNFVAIDDVVWSFKAPEYASPSYPTLWSTCAETFEISDMIVDVYSQLSDFLSIAHLRKAICFSFSVAAISDFIIAVAMCYYLHKSRSVTSFSSTSKKLLNLMRLVVISGLATSVCSLISLITFLVWPNSLIFIGIDFIHPKLYINSLLAMLNARKRHQSEGDQSRVPRALTFLPANTLGNTGETGVNILLAETRKSDHPKDFSTCKV
ncbi:hypothetical protein IW261DRAFT_1573510 [Armillaria novae-zelandiae]|uniref:DUF6534 domain-containing protein n=1 Tax=Armillaria novae-zelandiae TaxID=153914 RepID=A0AA39U7M7_9AGAR|nr:hypothetical protein IW261DRAFT_1573510 [Armillaria novae-zelandiae]